MIAVPFDLPEHLVDASPGAISPQAYALFKLIVKLSKRNGAACVNFLETLAVMFNRSVRATRYALAELLNAGWIGRKQTRRGGKSQLFLWPLVRVAFAGCIAACSGRHLQVTQRAPSKKMELGDNATNAVAVASDAEIPEQIQALGVGKTLAQKLIAKYPIERFRDAAQAVAAYLSGKQGNPAALLTVAVREGWVPPAPHPVPLHVSPKNKRRPEDDAGFATFAARYAGGVQ